MTLTLNEVFEEAMDELEARNPDKSDVADVIEEILSEYDLSCQEQAELAEQLSSTL